MSAENLFTLIKATLSDARYLRRDPKCDCGDCKVVDDMIDQLERAIAFITPPERAVRKHAAHETISPKDLCICGHERERHTFFCTYHDGAETCFCPGFNLKE